MRKKIFAALLSKEIGGIISDTERAELQQTLAENQKFASVYNEIHAFMHEKHAQFSEIEIDTKLHELWQKIAAASHSHYTIEKSARHIIPLWTRIAISVAIVIGLGIPVYKHLQLQNMYGEVLVADEKNRFAVLDDGTQIWLGKHSRIAYNKDFGAKNRKIRLSGEAFFDVAHRPDVPLTVSANKVEVTVKGTAFNVNAQQADVEVALLRGLVAVKDNRRKNTEEVLLHPNQKIVLRNGKTLANDSNYVIREMVQTNDAVIPETRWINDALVFQKQRFSDLAELMEERYRVTINIQNITLREKCFTGSIKSETLPQMLDALKQSYPFSYEITGKQVIIK